MKIDMMIGCNVIDNCDDHASCKYNHTEGGFRCKCNEEKVSANETKTRYLYDFSTKININIYLKRIFVAILRYHQNTV